ncbi:MAG: tRNA uridine-5-carboxymethylaminomethyl(34) synthesis GTPase MnmE [Firmicutes bacterium]|nr:tRNA uridine-5-carboxymethylaminomethyl(34) synthesis GTPase MnmE [Bacillota bacterium]
MFNNDTIAAISTSYGSGGIGIVRISGEKAFEIAERIFKGKKSIRQVKSHTIHYGKIVDPQDGSIIDEVLLTKMDGPSTFTRENIIEINCHGGIIVLKKVLELVIREGARLAEPGEFTKRAFLNGRIDLTQAEAVIDIINAKTARSSKVALEQLEGKLSVKIKAARDKLVGLIAHIEATLDYPEEDIDKITEMQIYNSLEEIRNMLSDLLSGFDKGKIIKEGIKAVIIGRPNVGKSSLLNQLTGYSRAIVTDIPGTTRDIIEEYINIQGIPVRVIDTAGIRETGDIVEKIGVEKTKKAIESADLIIMMIDAVDGFTQADANVLRFIKGKKIIVLLNKIDLVENEGDTSKFHELKGINELKSIQELEGITIIKTSMKDGRGINDLEKEISRLFIGGEIDTDIEGLMTNVRHASLVEKALNSINDAIIAYHEGMPMDCIVIDIRNAAQYLGEITGETVSDEILNHIFSRFCIGK